MRKISFLICVASLVSCCLLPTTFAAETPANENGEARGVWLHLTDFSTNAAQGKIEVRQAVERFAQANFNLIMPWVLSEYVAALTDTNYLRAAPNAVWDALGELVREAHQRGIHVHIWYSFTYYKSPRSPEFNPKHGGDPKWAARSLTDYKNDKNSMTDLCPLHPEARQWELKLIETMLDRYPQVSGIHIEEPGFGYPQSCVCDLSRSVFKSIHGRELAEMIDSPEAEDFRCLATTEFIRQLHTRLQQRKPQPVFSVNGGPFWRGDRKLGRDWKHWAELGWLDYYASQNYSGNFDKFASYTQTNLRDMQTHCPVFVGIGVKWSGGETALPVILKQVDEARKREANGVLFFSAKGITDEHLSALKNGPFKTPVKFPLLRP